MGDATILLDDAESSSRSKSKRSESTSRDEVVTAMLGLREGLGLVVLLDVDTDRALARAGTGGIASRVDEEGGVVDADAEAKAKADARLLAGLNPRSGDRGGSAGAVSSWRLDREGEEGGIGSSVCSFSSSSSSWRECS